VFLDVKFLDRIGGGGDKRGRFYLFILAWNLGVWVFGICAWTSPCLAISKFIYADSVCVCIGSFVVILEGERVGFFSTRGNICVPA
jgi:hypothetical protein